MTTTVPTPRVAGKRGRRPAQHRPALKLSLFRSDLTTATPPPTGDVTSGITAWGMLGNDQFGDCVPCATMHNRDAKAGEVLPTISDASTEQLYFNYGMAQGEPGPHPDQGCDIATWLKWLFDQGFIDAYAELNASNINEVHQAMLDYRGVIVGCTLTDDAEQEFESGQPWTITPTEQPDPADGHGILLAKYDTTAAVSETFVTWGALQGATVQWVDDDDLEAWVIITAEDAARTGVDLAQLRSMIQVWGGQVAPQPAPAPAPAPQPAPVDPPTPTPERPTLDEFIREVEHIGHVAIIHIVDLVESLGGHVPEWTGDRIIPE